MSISHKQHPARQQGKTLTGLLAIRYCLAANDRLMIGSNNIDVLYDRIKELYPEAKLSKHEGYVLVEKGEC